MTRRSPAEALECARNGRDVEGALDRAPHLVSKRSCGSSHTVWVGPRGSVVAATGHAGDIPRPTLRSICKMAAAAGLFVLVLLAAAPFVGLA